MDRSRAVERVTVQFEPRGDQTEVIVTHQLIPNETLRDMHQQGWIGCLDGLANYLEAQ
jgi:Activator of Hsp90 ATPase homolog 1-like protein